MASLGNETLEQRIFVLDLAGSDHDGVNPASHLAGSLGMKLEDINSYDGYDRRQISTDSDGIGTDSSYLLSFVDGIPTLSIAPEKPLTDREKRKLSSMLEGAHGADDSERAAKLREQYAAAERRQGESYMNGLISKVKEAAESGTPVVVVAAYLPDDKPSHYKPTLFSGAMERANKERAYDLVAALQNYENAVVVLMGPEHERHDAAGMKGVKYVALHDWLSLERTVTGALLKMQKVAALPDKNVTAPYRTTIFPIEKRQPTSESNNSSRVIQPEFGYALVAMQGNG